MAVNFTSMKLGWEEKTMLLCGLIIIDYKDN